MVQTRWGRTQFETRTVVVGGTEDVVVEGGEGRPERNRASVLTLRARVADVNAFAKGQFKPEDFAKKVSVSAR